VDTLSRLALHVWGLRRRSSDPFCGAGGGSWPFATTDILTARRRFRGIADMDRLFIPNGP
jgi:hypothetical protein